MRRSSSVLSRKVLSNAKAWRPDLKVKKEDCVFFLISERKGVTYFLFLHKITGGGEFKKRNLPALAPPRALCFII